jgi:adenosine kinase
VEYSAGGACQNSMRVAKWIGRDKFDAHFFGCIGDDADGKTLKSCLEGDGVKPQYLVDGTEKSGVCATLINGVNRSLVTDLRAANKYTVDELKKEENWKLVQGAKMYYITGYFLTVSVDSMVEVGKHAAATGKTFAMNLSAPFLCQFFKEQMHKVLPYVDIVFGNESEALEFAKNNDIDTTDVKEIAVKIASFPGKVNEKRTRVCIITQGADPTIVAKDGEVTEHAIIPMKREDIKDSNGAGDAFVGGFLSQFLNDKSIEDSIKAGNFAASDILKHSGCTFDKSLEFDL